MSRHVGYFDNTNIIQLFFIQSNSIVDITVHCVDCTGIITTWLNFRKFSKNNCTIHPNFSPNSIPPNFSKIWCIGSIQIWSSLDRVPSSLNFHTHLHYQSLRYKECKDASAMNMRDAKTGELLPLGCCMQVTTRAAIINWK